MKCVPYGQGGVNARVDVCDDVDVSDSANEEEEGKHKVWDNGERDLWRLLTKLNKNKTKNETKCRTLRREMEDGGGH